MKMDKASKIVISVVGVFSVVILILFVLIIATKGELFKFDNTHHEVFDPDNNTTEDGTPTLDQYYEYSKEVPINIIFTGYPEGDVAIKSYSLDHETVKIYGFLEMLNDIDSYDVEIDVSNLSHDAEYIGELYETVVIEKFSVNEVIVKVETEEAIERVFNNLRITSTGLEEGKKIEAYSYEDTVVDVTVKGPRDVVNSLTSDMIKPVINLEGYTSGTFIAKVDVTSDNKILLFKPSKDNVRVIISNR